MWFRLLSLISLLSLHVVPARTDQLTLGNCSPNIQGVNGSVNITCSSGPNNDPVFRITYFRIGGVALSLLMQGKLESRWKEVLGGDQDIIRTPPFNTGSEFLSRFSAAIEFDYLQGNDIASTDLERRAQSTFYYDGYTKTLEGSQTVLSSLKHYPSFPSNNLLLLFFPDVTATHELFRGPGWPKAYSVMLTTFDGNAYYPKLWRYVTSNDVDNYDVSYAKFAKAFSNYSSVTYPDFNRDAASSKRYRADTGAVIESIKYLTHRYFPENFLIILGEETGHGAWEFKVLLRWPELLVAVIENISEKPIQITKAYVKEVWSERLRPESVSTTELGKASERVIESLYPIQVLKASEKIIVPLRFQFYADSYDSAKPTQLSKIVKEQALVQRQPPRRLSGIFKDKDLPETGIIEPRLVARYDFGPSWEITGLLVSDTRFPARSYDPNNFILNAGLEKGSCPIIFIWDEKRQTWIKHGHILVGAVGEERKRTERLKLREAARRIRIEEVEGEEFFLDQVNMMQNRNGEHIKLVPGDPRLMDVDNKGVIVTSNSGVDITFDGDNIYQQGDETDIVINGFYVPWYYNRVHSSSSRSR